MKIYWMRFVLFFAAGFISISVFPLSCGGFYSNQPAKIVLGQSNFTTNISTVSAQGFNLPVGMHYDGERLFVTDAQNNRVLVYNTLPSTHNAPADVLIGQPDFNSSLVNRGKPSPDADTLYSPGGVFSDGEHLFVADTFNNRVLVYNNIPYTHDPNISASVVIGQSNFKSNGINQGIGVSSNTLYRPFGVWVEQNKLLIADAYNHRVLVYDAIPSTHNACANTVIGQVDSTGGAANQGNSYSNSNTLYEPRYICVKNNKLMISDTNNNRVLIFDGIPNFNNTSANIAVGQQDTTHGAVNQGKPNPDATTLACPQGVWWDGKKFYVAEYLNNRVLIFNSLPTGNNIPGNVVIGQKNFTSSSPNQGIGPGANTLSRPYTLLVANSMLFVADFNNHRVLIYKDLKPEIEKVFPEKGTNNISSLSLKIYGKNFDPFATVKLKRNGLKISTTTLAVETSTSILCGFDLTGKATGCWDIEVYNPDTSSYTFISGFTVKLPAPSISSVTPSLGLNTRGINVTITGDYFRENAQVKLSKTGYNDITATNVNVISSTTIAVTFDLTGKATGYWNITVTNEDGQSGILNNGFLVETFVITEILPKWWDNRSEAVVYIKGSDFISGSTVKLRKTGEEEIIGKSVSLSSDYTTLSCVFDLRKKSPGLWDLVVSSGQVSSVLSASFLIYTKPAGESETTTTATGSLSNPAEGVTITVPQGSELEGTQIIISSGSLPSNINITIIITINLVVNPPSLPSGVGRVGKVIDFSPGGLTFSKKATLKIPYRDSDLTHYGITDPKLLQVYYYAPWTEEWEEISGAEVDETNHLVKVQVDHFSFYTLGISLATSNVGIRIYPNPWRPSSGDKIWFSQLVPGSEVKIYTLTGELVRELKDAENTGRISWELKNSSGETVGSGIYTCVIADGKSKIKKKVAVIR